MSLDAGKILKILITKNSREEVLEYVQKYLEKNSKLKTQNSKKERKSLVIVTPNPEQIVLAQHDAHFAEILNRADVALPDGVGVVWASRLLFPPGVPSRVPGVEFMEDLVAMAAGRGVRVGLIGGRGGLAVKAIECLRRKYSNLQGWALEAPEVVVDHSRLFLLNHESRIPSASLRAGLNYGINFDISHDSSFSIQYSTLDAYFAQLARKIKETGAQIVFVGLGAPKQEYFIGALSRQLSVVSKTGNRKPLPRRQAGITDNSSIVLMSVGGAFDEISGRLPRAPKIFDTLGLKWLWRLILEPWRWRRQLALLQFTWLILRERLSGQFK